MPPGEEGIAVNGLVEACPPEDLRPTGKTLKVPSTRKGNAGGVSLQEGFVDGAGRAVTRHTVSDADGQIVHGPHFRPGGFF